MINRESILSWNEQVSWETHAPPTYKQFVNNLEIKMTDLEFLGDTTGLIRSEMAYDPVAAYQLVKETLIDRLQN